MLRLASIPRADEHELDWKQCPAPRCDIVCKLARTKEWPQITIADSVILDVYSGFADQDAF